MQLQQSGKSEHTLKKSKCADKNILGRIKLIVSFSGFIFARRNKGAGGVFFVLFFWDRGRGAAEKFFIYFLRQNRGAAAFQKGGAAEKFFLYFGGRIGMREPLGRFRERFPAYFKSI